ncbi:TPA: hypothetical protein QEM98_000477 [Stenotrophomonas maltophilia]|nr:hypothetical protein [Stenotrophomonas maltophilia]
MAQYFYDFKDAKPGAVPTQFERLGVLGSGSHQFAKADNGLFDIALDATGDYVGGRMISPLTVNAADVEVLAKIQDIWQNGGTTYPNGGFQVHTRVSVDNNTRYEFSYQGASTGMGSQSFVRSRVAGTSADIGTGSAGVSGKEIKWARVRNVGNQLQLRMWNDGTTEPSTWTTYTNNAITVAGKISLGWQAGNDRIKRIYQVGIGTAGDTAPSAIPGGSRTVSGTVRTPTGDLASGYIVRCYARSSGVLLGETLTDSGGNYAFSLTYADKVTCLAIDQLGNSWNAPVKDLVTPIAI